jgi:hypothetical protein
VARQEQLRGHVRGSALHAGSTRRCMWEGIQQQVAPLSRQYRRQPETEHQHKVQAMLAALTRYGLSC